MGQKKLNRRPVLKALSYEMTQQQMDLYRFPDDCMIADISKKQKPESSSFPRYRYYYKDYEFTCENCPAVEIWTAEKQRRWYEMQGGKPESIAILCNACRKSKKDRSANA